MNPTKILIMGLPFSEVIKKDKFQKKIKGEISSNTEIEVCVIFFHLGDGLISLEKTILENTFNSVVFCKESNKDWNQAEKHRIEKLIKAKKEARYPVFVWITKNLEINNGIYPLISYSLLLKFLASCKGDSTEMQSENI